LGQKIARREDGNVPVLAQVQEVSVAGYHVIRPGDQSTTKENIIVWVSDH
jgi:hypothetical protein